MTLEIWLCWSGFWICFAGRDGNAGTASGLCAPKNRRLKTAFDEAAAASSDTYAVGDFPEIFPGQQAPADDRLQIEEMFILSRFS